MSSHEGCWCQPPACRQSSRGGSAHRTPCGRRSRRYCPSDGDRSAPSGQGPPGQGASPRPQPPAPGAVRHTDTGRGARARPCRCVRTATDPSLPQPGPAARPRPRRRGTSHPVAARGGWHPNPSCPKASGPEGRDQSLSRRLAARTLSGPPAGIGGDRSAPSPMAGTRWPRAPVRPPSAPPLPAPRRAPRSARARPAGGGRAPRSPPCGPSRAPGPRARGTGGSARCRADA